MTSTVTFLMLFTFVETAAIVIMWWSRSPWWKYAAGRSIMALLVAQMGIIALAISSRVFGYDYLHRDMYYTAFYLLLAGVMAWVGYTILQAQIGDRLRRQQVGTEGKE